jgi:hypothetical protein
MRFCESERAQPRAHAVSDASEEFAVLQSRGINPRSDWPTYAALGRPAREFPVRITISGPLSIYRLIH